MSLETMTNSAYLDSIVEVLEQIRYVNVIDQLRPNDTYTVVVSDPEFLDLFLYDQDGFKDVAKEAVIKILEGKHLGLDVKEGFKNLKIKLVHEGTISMHDLDSRKEGETVCFEAIITATDAAKTYTVEADMECPECATVEHHKANFERKMPDIRCMNYQCKRPKMVVKSSNVVTDDIQTVLLQEPLELCKNHTPIMINAKLTNNNVGESVIGQRKKVLGVFRSQLDPKDVEHDIIIDILSIDDMDRVKEDLPSSDEIAKLRKESQEPDFIKKLIGSYAPDIYGYSDIKLSCLLQLVGGVPSKKRADINLLLVGDPSMAKSELLKYGHELTLHSIYTNGRGSSSAGLTIGMVKLSDGRMVAQAGVLPLCSGGFAYIDEFDKMNKLDRSAMHEAMEQQTVSIAKAGISLTLPAKTAILAAANPKYGHYDDTLSLLDNINISTPLLSRFDLIWLMKDAPNVTEDIQKANHILDTFASESKNTDCKFNSQELTSFLNLVRKETPTIGKDVRNEIVKIYEKLRATTGTDMTVGIRQLEALIRLSMAHAKLRFKKEVETEDIHAVKELLVSMYKAFGVDLQGTGTQSNLFTSGKMSKEQQAWKIWSECADQDGHVNTITFMKRLEASGMDQLTALQLFHRWENTNTIKLNSDGTYKKT